MRKLNILLVVPKVATKGAVYEFPLGLAYISSVIKQQMNDVSVDILNSNHYVEYQDQLLEKWLKRKSYDLILTGGMSLHWQILEDISKSARRFSPGSITVLGGPVVVSDIELAMENLGYTFGVIEEGEYTIVELLKKIASYADNKSVHDSIDEFSSIKSLSYIDSNGAIIITPKRGPVEPLDEIPFPDYEGFEYDEFLELQQNKNTFMYFSHIDQPRLGTVITSRSCPFNCTFCFHPLGKKYRQRSLNKIFEEIDYLVKRYQINVLNIMDELFSVDKTRMLEFAERIKPYNLFWLAQLRVTDVEPEVLAKMRDAGLFIISYGVESMDDSVLKSMNKRVTKAQIERALRLTREAKIGLQGNIILGDLAETVATVKNSMDWFKAHPEYSLNLGVIMTIPNSHIYQYAVQNGIIKDKIQHIKAGFPYVNITKMSDHEFKDMVDMVNHFISDYTFDGKPYYLYGSLLSSKQKDGYYEVQIKCPECGENHQYKLRTHTWPQINIFCKGCMFRMKFNTYQMYPFKAKVKNYFMLHARRFIDVMVKKNIINYKLLEKLKKLHYKLGL